MQPRTILTILVATHLLAALPAWFPGRRKRGVVHHGRELREYRSHLKQRTDRIDGVLGDVADAIEGLRRRDLDVDDAIVRLASAEDEEPYIYWKRGASNVTHARMRMAELAEVLVSWEPGRLAEANVTARLHRDEL